MTQSGHGRCQIPILEASFLTSIKVEIAAPELSSEPVQERDRFFMAITLLVDGHYAPCRKCVFKSWLLPHIEEVK
jgi:hypothetical protein